ncbi:NB-ARC domain-containing protein [Laspinema sp. D1]|uniref:NB-ARC domain-containing protein n=1 Tax=Laspinema palackyanum D2a TaxID=2953684 RepID=A0ABT2MIY9_9CYAN|nr:NB-ARC domain-containing protein [Laspinema sp. D2a]
MTTEELLQWADDIVFTHTEKHLDSVQTAILEGAWQGLKYEEIAKKCHRSKSHIKNIAAELWQTLSELLGENIQKANARSVLERKAISNIYNYGSSSQIITSNINSHISICPENRQYPEDARNRSPSNSNSPSSQNQPTIIDLTEAPELTDYYPRPTEESTLKQWILEDGMRLVTLYGLSGIGKSALTVKLIQDIQTEFDYIIWRSLGNPPPFSTLQTELYQFFSQSQPNPCATLIEYLRSFRCLIILDDVQNLFKSGEIAGQYLAEYEEYGKFFKQLAT